MRRVAIIGGARARIGLGSFSLTFLTACAMPSTGADLAGTVTSSRGQTLRAAFVTARSPGGAAATTVLTDADGRFRFDDLAAGEYELSAHRPGYAKFRSRVRIGGGDSAGRLEVALEPATPTPEDAPGSSFLSLLPNGEEKRRFILDCTGCHILDAGIALVDGRPRGAAGWSEAIERMLGFAGPASSFPVISASQNPESTAAFLSRHMAAGDRVPLDLAWPPGPTIGGYTLIEYDLPEPGDLPHDLQVDRAGDVVITGMFTHRMYRLSPATAEFETVAIPVTDANPRAVELDGRGDWWVLLGAPMKVAHYTVATGDWRLYDIGMYPHSIGLDARGHVWFNGHFSRDPELIGRLDPRAGAVTEYEVPAHPDTAEGPMPYELRIGPDGRIWGSELIGNRIFSFDPATERFDVRAMPMPHSGPRRLDVGPDGTVWIPEYAANRLARYHPESGSLSQFTLPMPDAAPYVVRVDDRRGTVWIGTGAADAILSFDPDSERFTVYPLPTRGALIRHLSVDERTGAVWAAYGAAPGIPARVAWLRPARSAG